MKNKLLLILFSVVLICNAQNKITEYEYQYDQEKTNAKGQRHGELLHSYDQSIEYKHIYNDGKPVEATNYRISVAGKKPVVGKYKDGNPFDGYFVYANEFEIPLIDYYEKGTFIAQYTCPLLDLLSADGQEMNIKWSKTIYKNNTPWEGLHHREEINLGGVHVLASEYFKYGLISDVDLWLMAENYGELIKIKFLPDGYTIYKDKMPSGGDPEIDRKARSITVHFKDSQNGNVFFEVENKLISKYQFINTDLSQKIKPVAGKVSYLFNDTTLLFTQHYDFDSNKKLYTEAYGNNQNIISQVFLGIDNQPTPYFSPSGINDYATLFQFDKSFNSNATLFLGENGNPFRGFFIEKEEQSDTYKYTQYLDSKIVAKGDGLPLNSLKKLILSTNL